jgi:hypothetical protein
MMSPNWSSSSCTLSNTACLNDFAPWKICSHGGRQHVGLTLDHALDELVHVVGELVVRGDELGVAEQALHVIGAWADGEDGGEDEKELLGAHGLHLESVVHRGDVEAHASLVRRDPGLLSELHVIDVVPGDG